ncbi:hypothetical protein D3C83_132820 [compost metagenome]
MSRKGFELDSRSQIEFCVYAKYSPESQGRSRPNPEPASKRRYLNESWKRALVPPRVPTMK